MFNKLIKVEKIPIDFQKFSFKDFVIQKEFGFTYLPIPCYSTRYYYQDKASFSALKKQKNKQNEARINELIRNGYYVQEDLALLKYRVLDYLRKAVKEKSISEPTQIVDDIHLKLRSESSETQWVLVFELGFQDTLAYWFRQNLGSRINYKPIWVEKTLKFPVESSQEIEVKELHYVCIDGVVITDASKSDALACAKASLLAYQQRIGNLYEPTPFIDMCCAYEKEDSDFYNFWTQTVYSMHKRTFSGIPFAIKSICSDGIPEVYYNTREEIIPVYEDSKADYTEPEPSSTSLPQNHSKTIDQAGKAGEAQVDYIIKWIQKKGFHAIVKDCSTKNRSECIILKNSTFIDESQEYDHILVFKGGIINIETKNYGGKIEISESGQWTQEKLDEARRGIESPVFQVDRHHYLLESIVADVPIFDIICIANAGCEISGIENCPIPIVKYDMLQRYLTQLQSDVDLSETQIQEIIKKINHYKLYSKDKD